MESITAPFLLRPVQVQLNLHLHRISKACSILLICPFNLGVFNSAWKSQTRKKPFLIFTGISSLFYAVWKIRNLEDSIKRDKWGRTARHQWLLIELRGGTLHSTAARVLRQAKHHGKAQLYSKLKTKKGNVLKYSRAGQTRDWCPDVQIRQMFPHRHQLFM